jgi:hypothetical protein
MLTGCSVYPHEIPREYVSSDRYRLYNCEQMERESARIDARASEIAATLAKFAQDDPPRNGLPLWPAYARLKGEHAALQQSAMYRQCAVTTRLGTQAPIPASAITP